MKYTPMVESANPAGKVALGPAHTAVLYDNIKSVGEIEYTFILAVFANGSDEPVLFVASEVNKLAPRLGGGSHFMGVFEEYGHANMGDSNDWADGKRFFPEALRVAARKLGITADAPKR